MDQPVQGYAAATGEVTAHIRGRGTPPVSRLRRAWDHLPPLLRRPIMRAMRHERLRLLILNRLGIRPEASFITLSHGGPEALDAAFDRIRATRVTGDYYEFGVFRGYTLWYAQQAADRASLGSMRFFGFDSFQWLPEVRGADRRAGMFVAGDYRCSAAAVTELLDEHGFDWSRGALIEGYFDDSLTPSCRDAHRMRPAALVMIDCDLYQSTVPVLNFLSELLQDGTVVLFDDWYCFSESSDQGEPRAFAEFLADHREWSAKGLWRFGAYGRAFEMHRGATPVS